MIQAVLEDIFDYCDEDIWGIINYDDISFEGKDKVPSEIADYMRENIVDYYDVDFKPYNEFIAKKIVEQYEKDARKEMENDSFNLKFVSLETTSNHVHTYITVETESVKPILDYMKTLDKDYEQEGTDEKFLQDYLDNLNVFSKYGFSFRDFMKDVENEPELLAMFSYNIDDLNDAFTFKPELETITDLQYYKKEGDEYVWNKDVPGQLKLKLESFKELNEALEKFI